MWKPIAAGLMCLGFVTLGVAASRAEEEEGKLKGNLIVVGEDEKPTATSRKKTEPAGGNVVEIRIGEDGGATFVGKGEIKNAEGGDGVKVILQNEDESSPKLRERARMVRAQVSRNGTALPAIDSETRQALEKMIGNLKEEAKRLQGEDKKEEAEKKSQSVRALEQLLNPGPHSGAMSVLPAQQGGFGFVIRTSEDGPAHDEMKKLSEKLRELQEEAAKAGEGNQEARDKLQCMMAELQKTAADRHRRKLAVAPGANPFGPGASGTPAVPGTPLPSSGGLMWKLQPGAGGAAPGAVFFTTQSNATEADELTRKADALSQASAKLKEAGLEPQSRELHEQAQKLKAHAEKIRAKTSAPQGFGPWGAGGFAGGPPAQLQRSIHELQEQVQQLRKEIGELRELLQRKP